MYSLYIMSSLIYSDINEKINYLNVILIDIKISDYQKILNLSSNLETLSIVYSTFSSKIDLLDLLQNNFTQINRIAIFTTENINIFLDNKPLFLDEEIQPNSINVNNINQYSENLQFILNLIYDFNIKNIDFLAYNSLNSSNRPIYYDFLHQTTGVIVGTTNNKINDVITHGGDWITKSTSQKIEEPTYYKNIEKYMYLLKVSSLFTITSGTYDAFEYAGNYIIKFNSDGECYFNYNNINVNYIIVGGGGSGGGDNFNSGGGGGGGAGIVTDSFNSVANNTLSITIGSGGVSVLSQTTGYNGNSSSISYNNATYTAQGGYGGFGTVNINGGNGGNSGVASGTGGAGGSQNTSGSNGSNGGGGGGAGGDDNAGSYSGGNGSVTTYSVYYYETDFGAGGGGGGSRYESTYGGTAGNVYAGNGGREGNGNDATPGYGGGGGGAGASNQGTKTTGAGGSGTVVLYFSITPPTPTPTPTPTPISVSNICFIANTPIKCDQGIYPISKIDPKIHTIQNKKIIAITKSITQDKHLVRIDKDAFSLNYPNKNIILTKKHNIYYKGKMIQAQNFINYFDKIKLVKYNGEILYNILMEKYDTINVNNILCETLHPENIIAKIYMSFLSEDYKNKITIAINDCIKKNDYNSYKKIEQRLNKELEYVKHNVF